MTAEIKIKWVYEPATEEDGLRILVDRLWPRGMSKERVAAVYWARSVSPSNDLRKWYGHDPEKWEEFRLRYAGELDANPDGVVELLPYLESDVVTFLYSSKERELNNAVALRDYLLARMRQARSA